MAGHVPDDRRERAATVRPGRDGRVIDGARRQLDAIPRQDVRRTSSASASARGVAT
jgi:hypothetical protein